MTELRIYSVTLAFTPPGPLHTSLVIAQDEANASAMAMQHAMGNLPIVTPLATVLAVPVDPDVLRQMLRAVEGRGPGEVVSLVPKSPLQTMDEIVSRGHKHESCRCPAMAGEACPLTAEECTARARHGFNPNAQQRAAEILRKHEPDLDAADASTFAGRNVDHMWNTNRQPPLRYWGEEYGPPWPGGAA